MGLFSFFSKKEPSHEKKIALAYKCYNPNLVSTVFPRGKEQADIIIRSLATILGIDLSALKALEYYRILTIYSDIFVRRLISKAFDNNTIIYLMHDYAEYIKNETLAHQVHAYCAVNMIEKSYALTSTEDIRTFEEAQTKYLDDDHYGLTTKKPIYTIGVTSTRDYLNSLKASTGEEITWERSVSYPMIEGVKGIVDAYDTFLASGQKYKRIYINMYGTWTSKKAPNGFNFK